MFRDLVRTRSFAAELDPDFYRKLYQDLRAMSEADATQHFRQYGIAEGRHQFHFGFDRAGQEAAG